MLGKMQNSTKFLFKMLFTLSPLCTLDRAMFVFAREIQKVNRCLFTLLVVLLILAFTRRCNPDRINILMMS